MPRTNKGIIKKDLTGIKFLKLTVLKFDSWVIQGKNTRVSFWLCQCDCGNQCKVKGTHLSRGDTKSCGCYKPNCLGKGEASFNFLLSSYKRHAKNRNYSWDLTKDQTRFLTKQNCHYCNSSPTNKIGGTRCNEKYVYNGIDRKNNNLGYILENCVSCCKTCNRMKSDMTYDDFLIHIDKIYRKNTCNN